VISKEAAETYIAALESIRQSHLEMDQSLAKGSICPRCETDDQCRDDMFIDVLSSSYQYWDSALTNEALVYYESEADSMFYEKLDALMLVYWDASGCLLGGLLGGYIGAFIGTCIASAAFILWGEEYMHDMLDIQPPS
jgi:hypothetical protein